MTFSLQEWPKFAEVLRLGREFRNSVVDPENGHDAGSCSCKMNVLPLTEEGANSSFRLRQSGVRVGTMDLRIGSIALIHGFAVLTPNTIDFERITGLRVEDWTRPVRPG